MCAVFWQEHHPLPNPVAPETGGAGTKAGKRSGGGSAKPPATKKRRSKHGFLVSTSARTGVRWSAEIRDNIRYDTNESIFLIRHWLETALAYDAFSRRLYGLNAKANFAAGEDLPPLLLAPAPVVMPYAAPPKRPKKCNTAMAPPQAVDTPAAAAGGVELTSLLYMQRGGAGAGGAPELRCQRRCLRPDLTRRTTGSVYGDGGGERDPCHRHRVTPPPNRVPPVAFPSVARAQPMEEQLVLLMKEASGLELRRCRPRASSLSRILSLYRERGRKEIKGEEVKVTFHRWN
uniref:AP2/ERF domain-containing protein n=1 Tax=Oryza nivara TaxID=4536 RepID=A0A0E0GZD3_ORYNI